MRRILILSLVLAATPASASAATLTTQLDCYQETGEVVFFGVGYTPLSTVSVSSNGRPLGTAVADGNGSFESKFVTPELPGHMRERLYELSATDALNVASTRYRATKVYADFNPAEGNSRTLMVRFSINGFGLARKHPLVYLHYVAPNGRAARTVRLGRATGTCGLIRRTHERRLFPFNPVRGKWVLQFDTNRIYVRGTRNSKFPWVRKPVLVFSSRS